LLPRERQLAWLEMQRQRKLVLLVGPAGCGRTSVATLLQKARHASSLPIGAHKLPLSAADSNAVLSAGKVVSLAVSRWPPASPHGHVAEQVTCSVHGC
jgi:replication-associated recombination protein RarA